MKRGGFWIRQRGLLPQFFTVVILPISLLLGVVAFGGLALHQQEMRMLAGERDTRTAQAVAATLKILLQQRLDAIQRLARQPVTAASADERFQALCQVAAEPGFDLGLAYYSLDRRQFTSCGGREFWSSLLPETTAVLAETIAKQRAPSTPGVPWIGALEGGSGQGQAVFSLAPWGDGALVGASTPAGIIQPAFQTLQAHAEHLDALVIDSRLNNLYQVGQPAAGEALATHPGVREALEGQTGSTFMQTGDAEHVVAYSPVTPLGWALLIEEPWSMVASPMLRTTENAPLVLIPAFGLALVALWYAARFIVRPLQRLEQQSARLGWGDFQAIEAPVGGIAEIQMLQNTLILLAHQVSAAQQGLRDYIGVMTRGQEEERRRLARELHDDTLQALIALNQRIQLVQLGLQEGTLSQSAAAVAELQALVEQTIQDLRRTTRALRPIYLEELGLAAALEMLAREAGQSSGLEVAFHAGGAPPYSHSVQRLPSDVELALYRLTQEALNNVIHHAQAKQVSLRLGASAETGEVLLEVRDDGQGFIVPESPAAFAPGGHFGLLGMQERAEMIAARLKIESRPGAGTRVTVLLPKVEG